MTALQLIEAAAQQLEEAGVSFGHGTTNAFDEAAWLVLWQLGLPLDTPLDGDLDDVTLVANQPLAGEEQAKVASLLRARIESRKPAAYLTHEAWLQGVPFYVDERVIVPRSLIAELLAAGSLDYWLQQIPHHADAGHLRVLDLCTGNGSLAVLAAMAYADAVVTASDISTDALDVARINVDKHELQDCITLLPSDGLTSVGGPFDLILCNPPYVNAHSMTALPAEYQAEPALALSGNALGGTDGMDFIRQLILDAPAHMSEHAVLVLEIGNEQAYFDAAFPGLDVIWLDTSAGEDQVLLVTRNELIKNLKRNDSLDHS
jgi:ribosomal protein L3 glutamine methyltransferase